MEEAPLSSSDYTEDELFEIVQLLHINKFYFSSNLIREFKEDEFSFKIHNPKRYLALTLPLSQLPTLMGTKSRDVECIIQWRLKNNK